MSEIPGITSEDRFPGGCVDCHVKMPDRSMDVRLSAQMRPWYREVDRRVLDRLEPMQPRGAARVGPHPVLQPDVFRDVPASCRACHVSGADAAPSLGPMLHLLHLTGGRENHFMTLFGGECTHCHKLDPGTGRLSLPSGPEK